MTKKISFRFNHKFQLVVVEIQNLRKKKNMDSNENKETAESQFINIQLIKL